MKNKYLKYAFFLGALAFFVSLLLTITNLFTSSKIKNNEINKVLDYLKEVNDSLEWKVYENDNNVYLAYEKEDIKMYAFKTTNIGYNSGEVVSLNFIENDLIKSIKIISMENQTSGIGTQIAEEEYLRSFEGDSIHKYLNKESIDLKEDIITGATITSKAFLNGIIQASEYYYNTFYDNKDYTYLNKISSNWKEKSVNDEIIKKIYISEDNVFAYKGFKKYLLYGDNYAEIEILFFIKDNKIVKINVLYNSQTSEYGLKINDQNYLDSFIERSVYDYANKNYHNSDVISGSTITSNAFLDLLSYLSDYYLKGNLYE